MDLGGNVRFLYKDTAEETEAVICQVLEKETYEKMKAIAEEKGIETFAYSQIAKRSIELQ